ncbi:hypothetical protein N4G58_01520 [Edwardsiella piscicida]|nr:hypothetical protein N4G58_01520 [Edwardsiella piscicida]
MPRLGVNLQKPRVALVVVDPQIDFLSPKGAGWSVLGESVTENNTVAHLEALFRQAKRQGMLVAVSPTTIIPTIINGYSAGRVSTLCIIPLCSTGRGR